VSLYLWLITIALMGIFMQVFFTQRDYYKNQAKALTAKAACTAIAVLVCLYGLTKAGGTDAKWILFAGLCLCMVADVIIGIHFVAGMLVFLCAHLCFIAYFITLAPLSGYSAVVFLIAFTAVLIGFWRFVPQQGIKSIPFMIYAAVLLVMFSIAALLPYSIGGIGAVLLAAGASLFTVSDLILAWNTLGSYHKIRDRLVLYLYYPAVYLLAVSVFYQ
jgi:uncharacterized membrane protein YhhN